MSPSLADLRDRNPFPEGTIPVGVGLVVTALSSYAFLIFAARTLGLAEMGALSILWSLVFMIGGALLPFEQEVSRRLVTLRVAGHGGRSVIVRSFALGSAVVGAVCIVVALAGPTLQERVFLGEPVLVFGLALGAVGYLVANLTKGVLSGNNRWPRYGAYLGIESSARLAICLLFVAIGVRTAGPIGLALGGAPILTTVLLMTTQRDLAPPGPEIAWRELASGLGALLAAAVLSQVIINASPVLVGFLAGPDRTAEAGVFTTALFVARVPLFAFQAVQVAMLPKLSALAAEGRFDEFRVVIRRIAMIVAALITVGTLLGVTVGPQIIQLAFGEKYVIGQQVVGLLTVASGGYIMATALSLAIIALGGSKEVAIAWTLGVVTLFAAVLFGDDPIMRVAIAFAASTAVTTIVAAIILRLVLRRGAALETGPVLDAINDITLES